MSNFRRRLICTISKNKTYIKDGLILWYDGINNTRSGHSSSLSKWEDLSGNNNDAILTNVSPTEKSMNFLGTSNGSGAVSGDINYTKNFTFEVLFKTKSTAKFVLDARNYGDIGYQLLYINSSNSIQIYSTAGGGVNNVILKTNITNGNENLISIVFENNIGYIYVNGVLENQFSITGQIYTSKLYIGERHSLASNFVGYMSNIRIYNRALLSNEISNNYNIDKDIFSL